MVEKLLTERTTEQDVTPPGIPRSPAGQEERWRAPLNRRLLSPVLPAKPAKAKVAPAAMTDTSSLLNEAEWYWGEISRLVLLLLLLDFLPPPPQYFIFKHYYHVK